MKKSYYLNVTFTNGEMSVIKSKEVESDIYLHVIVDIESPLEYTKFLVCGLYDNVEFKEYKGGEYPIKNGIGFDVNHLQDSDKTLETKLIEGLSQIYMIHIGYRPEKFTIDKFNKIIRDYEVDDWLEETFKEEFGEPEPMEDELKDKVKIELSKRLKGRI